MHCTHEKCCKMCILHIKSAVSGFQFAEFKKCMNIKHYFCAFHVGKAKFFTKTDPDLKDKLNNCHSFVVTQAKLQRVQIMVLYCFQSAISVFFMISNTPFLCFHHSIKAKNTKFHPHPTSPYTPSVGGRRW